jgi:hypothetical protein
MADINPGRPPDKNPNKANMTQNWRVHYTIKWCPPQSGTHEYPWKSSFKRVT